MGPNLRLSSQRQCCLQEGRNSCHTSPKTPGRRRGRSRSRTPSERTLRVSRNLKAFGHRTSSSIPGRLLASLWAARWSSSRHFAIAGRETASWAWMSTRAGSCCPFLQGSSARRCAPARVARRLTSDSCKGEPIRLLPSPCRSFGQPLDLALAPAKCFRAWRPFHSPRQRPTCQRLDRSLQRARKSTATSSWNPAQTVLPCCRLGR